jgi:hypothetical protein
MLDLHEVKAWKPAHTQNVRWKPKQRVGFVGLELFKLVEGLIYMLASWLSSGSTPLGRGGEIMEDFTRTLLSGVENC